MNENTVLVRKLRKGLQELERQRNEGEYEQSKYKLGRILTVVDSAIADPEQRKATKDLVNTIWYEGNYGPLSGMNGSREAMLFEALTNDELWESKPMEPTAQVAKRYNPFEEPLSK